MERKPSGMGLAAVVSLLLAACSTSSVQPPAENDYLLGDWQGAVQTPVGDLPVTFHITGDQDGLSCVLDNPNQSNIHIPCGDIAVEEDAVHIVVPWVKASYTGTLDANTLSGHWSQAGLNFHLQLSRLDASPSD